MHFTLASCLLSIAMLAYAEAARETTTLKMKDGLEGTSSIEAYQPKLTMPPQRHDVELKQRADSDYSDLIGFYSISGYCMLLHTVLRLGICSY